MKVETITRLNKIVNGVESKGKFECMNGFERKQIHEFAQQHNLPHRTVIDYTRIHIFQSKITSSLPSGKRSKADKDTPEIFQLTLTPKPYSYVEIGHDDIPIIIGSKSILPTSITLQLIDTVQAIKVREARNKIRNEHKLRVDKFQEYLQLSTT
jgi:hypothetical protein